jgi:hypothetical protein
MSIGLYITNPRNLEEKNIYVPIAAESFFEKSWLPAAENLGLNKIKLFQIGLDVDESNLKVVQEELEIFKNWVKVNLPPEEKEFVLNRIEYLEGTMQTYIVKEGLSLYIG